jgi:colanic acid/amylovoran biosynthesis glycosyltransferase
MPRSTLLLYTFAFPYGHTEAFLETEIQYLNEVFGTIFIIPSSKPKGKRVIPDSIKVIDDLTKRSDWPAFRKFMHGFIRSIGRPEFWGEISANPRLLTNTTSLYRLINMQGGADYTYNITKNMLKTYGIVPSDTVAYSYWLDYYSLGFCRLKEPENGIKFISRGHRFDIYNDLYDPPHIPYQEKNLKLLDRMIYISRHGQNHVTGRYPFSSEKSIISRLGVKDPGFQSFGSEKGELHVVSCSALVPVKRIDLLVVGLSRLSESNPEIKIKWTHIGDGPQKNDLIAKCKISLTDVVEYEFTGQMSNSDVLNFYRTRPVDVLVNVSTSEGIPVTMMEAQSCGIPICGTDVGGVNEIADQNNGCLLPANPQPDEIAGALASFSDPEYRKLKSGKSRLNWENNFNAEKNYREFSAMLSNL